MADPLRKKLAPIYAPFLSELFDRPAVEESRATCNDCAMCEKGGGPAVPMDYFKPDLKCCTYHPNLPNFLVGAILSDPDPALAEGRRRIRERIERRIAISPCWVAAPKKFQLLVMASRGTNVFGRAKSLLCPYYDGASGGLCTIWKHREAVCSTFFCKYEGGRPGFQFWTSLKAYLEHVEITLAHAAMRAVDAKLVEPKMGRLRLTAEDIDDLPPNAAEYDGMWRDWVGREADFYVACFEYVRDMGRDEFIRLVDGTPDGKKSLLDVRSRWDKLTSPQLPKTLALNSKLKVVPLAEQVVVTSYNPNDSFALDKELYEVLAMLDPNKTVAANLETLAREHGIELAPELLQHLYIHGVLAPPTVAKQAPVCSTSD